ncbi:SLC13 family permease [Faecalispora anaeroviscerum]|uniref:SLC13 family permease n=1 Tax=Faecalispora anaeroviscerum TaxID=2991836 RepID=UPI0024B9D659|nr:SLC13 family permease [Faecalispora anaeroviscerum]
MFAVLSMLVVPPSTKYLSYIDFKTLSCLFCLMASILGLQAEGILEKASLLICSRISNSRVLTFFLVFACYFLSMLVTNDVALITIIPTTLAILSACELDEWSAYIVVLQTIAANVGSAMTPFGNPQNLYLFSRYQIGLADFFVSMLPVGLLGGLLLAAGCLLISPLPLQPPPIPEKNHPRPQKIVLYCMLFLLSVASVFNWLPYQATLLVLLAVLIPLDRKTLASVDYSLLATFFFIFVLVGNLGSIESVDTFLSCFTQNSTIFSAILTSQFISNVPAAILLSGFTEHARQLLIGVNIGGLGTLIASMASVISYKFYISIYQKSTGRYLKLFTVLNLVFLAVLTVFELVWSC